MAESFVPALVPRAGAAGAASLARAAVSARAMSVAGLPALSYEARSLYRIAALDDRGRIAEQSVLQFLGWSPEQRVEIRVVSGSVLVRRDAAGVFVLTRRGHVPIPPAVRRWCALAVGDRVLLIADPDRGRLVVHTMATLEQLVVEHHDALGGELS